MTKLFALLAALGLVVAAPAFANEEAAHKDQKIVKEEHKKADLAPASGEMKKEEKKDEMKKEEKKEEGAKH